MRSMTSHPLVVLARRYATPLFAVLTVVGIAVMLWGQRRAIADFDWSISPVTLILAALLFAVPCWVQAVSFHFILVQVTPGAPPAVVVWIWMRSFLVRYAPSGLLAFALRVKEPERLRASAPQVLLASVYEQLIAIGAGALVCVLAFLATRTIPPLLAVAIAVLALGMIVALRPGWAARWAGRLLARFGVSVEDLVGRRWLLAAVGMNMLAWLATGAASWLLIEALGSGPMPSFHALLGVVAFAWLIGVLVPILPGGLGVREGVLIGLLVAWYPLGVATALALGLRLIGTVGELVAIGSVEAAAQATRLRRQAEG